MLDFTSGKCALRTSGKKVGYDEPIPRYCGLGKHMRPNDLIRDHKTQTSRKRLGIIVCNRVQLAMFHTWTVA